MKKSVIAIFLIIVLLFISYFAHYYKIEFVDTGLSDELVFTESFFDWNEKTKNSYKDAVISIDFTNYSLRTVKNIMIEFADGQDLPDFIVKNKFEGNMPWPFYVKPFKKLNLDFYFVADADKCTKEEMAGVLDGLKVNVLSNDKIIGQFVIETDNTQ